MCNDTRDFFDFIFINFSIRLKSLKFAVAFNHWHTDMNDYIINLQELACSQKSMTMLLDDAFFDNDVSSEICGGHVEARLSVSRAADEGHDYDLSIYLSGTMRVPCTRCADAMDLPVDVEDNVKVIRESGDAKAQPADDDILTADAKGFLDLAPRMMETLRLNIPLVHVHPEGECNPETIKWLKEHSAN